LLQDKKYKFNSNPQWFNLENKITAAKNDCEKKYKDIQNLFCKGKILEGKSLLEDFLNKYRDHKNSKELNNELKACKNRKRTQLIMSENNLSSLILFKDSVILGREDYDIIPDIIFDDQRISRKHLTMKIKENKCIIEDNNSTGGTFLNGNKIKAAELNNDDSLNLSKILEFKVHVYKDRNQNIGGIILTGKNHSFVIVASEVGFCIDDNILSITKSDYKIYYQSNIPLISWDSSFMIITKREIQTQMGGFILS